MKISDSEWVASLAHALCQRIGEPRYKLWFHDKTRFTLQEEVLVVGVPNRFFQEWLQKTFAGDVQDSASATLCRPLSVQFVIDPQLFQDQRQRETQTPLVVPEKSAAEEPRREARPVRTRRWRRLDDFVVGPCNRVAHASALSIVEAPGQGPNPLVVHGPVGTGKTHLLEGTYLGLRRHDADARVLFVTAEDFTNRFVQAMRAGKLSDFRKQFRDADALLVDDVNFLAKKLATQEEFLHTLDALMHLERPVMLTCDCHPRLAEQFLPELTDRLLGGAVWSLNLPDKDTRLGLLRTKSLHAVGQGPGLPRNSLPADVLEFMAEHMRGNVRELEGALHTLLHFARVTARPINLDLAREALAEVLRHSIRVIQLDDVERAVCAVLGLDADALRGQQRGWKTSHPRMLAVYLARKHTSATYTEIGQHLGGRNHSTAVAAEKKVRQWLQEEKALHLGQRHQKVRDALEKIERDLLR